MALVVLSAQALLSTLASWEAHFTARSRCTQPGRPATSGTDALDLEAEAQLLADCAAAVANLWTTTAEAKDLTRSLSDTDLHCACPRGSVALLEVETHSHIQFRSLYHMLVQERSHQNKVLPLLLGCLTRGHVIHARWMHGHLTFPKRKGSTSVLRTTLHIWRSDAKGLLSRVCRYCVQLLANCLSIALVPHHAQKHQAGDMHPGAVSSAPFHLVLRRGAYALYGACSAAEV